MNSPNRRPFRWFYLVLSAALLLGACNFTPQEDQPLTEDALQTAVSSTLTAAAPTETNTALPTTPAPPSQTPTPTITLTLPPPPSATPTPIPSPTLAPPAQNPAPPNPPAVYIIQGSVVDDQGAPVSMINLALIYRPTGQRYDVYSGPDGRFQQAIPAVLAAAPWTVEVVGYDCRSRVMDGNCKLTAFSPPRNIEQVDLPQNRDLRFVFQSLSAVQPPPVAGGGCPQPAAGSLLYSDAHLCFLYPASPGYVLTQDAHSVKLTAPSDGNSVEPIVPYYTIELNFPNVGSATSDQVAEQWVVGNGLGDLPRQFYPDQVGGYPATLYTGEPGILPSQRIFVVVNGNGYTFYLWPSDTPSVAGQVNTMWNLLMDTIHFK